MNSYDMNIRDLNRLYRLLAACLLALTFAGCEDVPQMMSIVDGDDGSADTLATLNLSQPEFSPDYKTMVLDARLGKGIGLLPLSDPEKVRVRVTETSDGILTDARSMQPTLVSVDNIAAQKMVAQKVKMLVLVDLTLPQAAIDQERRAVEEIRNMFFNDNLYVAFIQGTTVSETMLVTDYLLAQYFVHIDADVKYLYRAVVDKMAEMKSDSAWAAGARYKALTVLSDGATYQDDLPMDPEHFELEHQLAVDKSPQPLYYANFSTSKHTDDIPDALDDLDFMSVVDEAADGEPSVLQRRCMVSGGLYQQQFDWPAIESKIQKSFGLDLADYRFTLENPDHKVYRGRHPRDLKISCYDAVTDSLLAEGDCIYSLGSVYSPIIVHPISLRSVLLQGCLYTLFLILLVYAVLQLLVPYVSYRLFLRKYVVTYNGRQMSNGEQMVGQSCYLCKTPFAEGEQVVTKCQHTMHLACWEENHGQCPEYGRHCHDGRHYYNRQNLLDPQNSTFYRRWVIVAILAGWASWVAYTVQIHPLFASLSEQAILFFSHLTAGTPEANAYIAEYGSHINHFPSFGLCMGFFLTLMLSCLSVARRDWWPRLFDIGIRALLGGVGGLLFFLVGGVITVQLGLTANSFIIDWIPWSLTAFWIALCVTWRTRISLRHRLIAGAFAIGLLSTYLWAVLYIGSSFDYRVSLLTIFILFAVALGVGIASKAPRSERYFLSVDGISKQMDIALYKWFKANPDDVVTIGLSVDCSLQLSWDIQSSISPIQAEVRMQGGVPWLYAVDDGVLVSDKTLQPGKGIRLYHGRRFVIGKTEFTYIEKDK